MRNFIILLAAALFACSCSDRKEIVQDNTFTLSCDSGDFSGNVLTFEGVSGYAVIHVNHGPTATRWTVSSSIDDVWCSFRKNTDDLVVTVDANSGESDREARATVVMGDKSCDLIVRQKVYVIGSNPNTLPDTIWDANNIEL